MSHWGVLDVKLMAVMWRADLWFWVDAGVFIELVFMGGRKEAVRAHLLNVPLSSASSLFPSLSWWTFTCLCVWREDIKTPTEPSCKKKKILSGNQKFRNFIRPYFRQGWSFKFLSRRFGQGCDGRPSFEKDSTMCCLCCFQIHWYPSDICMPHRSQIKGRRSLCASCCLTHDSDATGFLRAGSPSSIWDLRGSTKAFMLF